MKSFEQYLRDTIAQADGSGEFRILATLAKGQVKFYIHPMGKDGTTGDFAARGNHVSMLADASPDEPPPPVPQPTPSPIMRHFSYEHLPPHLADVSAPLCDVARHADQTLPACAEKSAGLRKLLEAKDCLVRAKLEQPS